MNDEVKKLYSALLGKGYSTSDLGDEETFRAKMSDKNSRKELYDWVSSKGNFRLGDYESYENRLTSSMQQPEQPAAAPTVPEVETPATPTGETPLTEQDRLRFSAGIEQMKRRTRQSMDDFNERMATMREYHENAPLGGGQTAEGRMMFNPQSGKVEKTYITPLGNRYTSKGLADMESFRYRQAADMSVSGQLRRARLKLAELKSEKEAARSRASEKAQEFNKTKLTGLGQLLVGADIYRGQVQSDPETNAYDVAIHETEELIARLEREQQRENGNESGYWRGLGSISLSDFDFGFGELNRNLTRMHADKYMGENATDGEREAYNEMMGAQYLREEAEQAYPDNWWYEMGVQTKNMAPFALDFLVFRGTTSLPSVFTKGGTRVTTKVIGKEVVEEMAEQGFKTYVRNNGIKGFGQYAGNWTIKALGTMGDDLLIRAPLMTNTVQFGKTTSDIIDRKLGDVVVNEDGIYDFSNDKTWGSAIWQGEANAIIENYSEMFGAHLDPVVTLGNMSKLANVVGAKRLGAVLSKADAGALSGIMGQTHQLFNKMGVSDYFGEVTEEYYGQMWRTMLNLDDAYQQNPDGTRTNLLATGQFHGDVWGGMALSMGLMGAGKHTLSAAHYTSMKHSVNKADAHATELLGKEVWEPLRTSLDLTTNEDMGAMAEAIVNDKDFTDEERAAVLTYMERSMMMRGYNLGTLAQRRGAAQDEDVQALDESYIDGYSIESSQEMNDAKNMYDYQRQRALAIIEEDFLADIENDPAAHLDYIRNSEDWSDEERGILLDYLNSKQVYDGMIQRVRDDIDGRIDQSNAMVNARTNRTTGMIQGATMKVDDRRVYVINGNLVQYADGSGIDIEASDNSIIVRDAETGALEQVSPDAILNIDEALDPITEMQTAADAIRQQYAQEAANRIDGVVTFNPGDTYTITGDDAQIQVQIVANDEGIVDNGDGTVNVSDGTNVFPLAKETIQQQAEAAQLARVAQFEQQRVAENAAYQQAVEEESRPQYALNDLVSLRDENGNAVRGNITTDADADGRYEVYTEAPINGKRVNLFTRDELDSMLMEHNGVVFEQPADNEGNNGGENIPESGNNAPQNIPAMQRIPKDMQGNPLYEQTDSDTAWDAIVEQTEGDEAMAQTVADGMVADKEAALKKLEKAKSKGGDTIAEKIAAEKERKAAIDAAQQEVNIWKKIAGTANRRKMDAEAERRRIADEAAALRKAEEEKLRAEREEAERIEREALNGVPDMVDDTPQDARARGYRRVSGHKIDRQEPVQGLQGKEVAVRFSDDAIANGRVAVIDATQLQPSHIQGVRNPLHFIDEAQPKERNDEASVMSARKIAGNIRPEEITSSVTAYTGAPTVNTRGEAIQGNNRSDALRLMWESHEDQAAQYKQYLIDHAEEFGLNADDVAAMERPVLVNMLDVDDAEAITLGQFVAQDTESGGTERIKPKNALQKMGNDMRSFANLLLKSNDEDTSFAGLVDNNGVEVLKWMSQRGYITPTQYKSAFDSKGNLTAEAKNDLRGIMYQSIFKGGSTRLEEMFNAMPAKAQKAILATAFRDYDSPNADRMIEEIQNSIRAFYALSQSEDFVNAKTFKDARLAVEGWKIQYQIDDVTGESYLPAENFSNFALLLATMYKGENQSVIQGTFNKLYDLIQGTQEPNLFEQPDNTPRSLAQAIYETLNITYDGQQRSNVLVGDSSASQRGQQGSTGDAATGERIESGERTADSAGSIEAESTTGGEAVHQPQPERKGLEQTSDGGRETDGTGVADDATQEVLGASNRGDIRVLEEGLDTSYREYSEYSERTRRTTESERLVSLAKQHGLFIPAEVTKTLTGKYPKRTGESVVYIDTAAGKVTKVKDPYAKAAMKSGVQPEDAAFEHRVHNLLFPETAYTLEGISEEMGDVRIVLSQDFIQNYDQPTKEQIAEALAARGLFPEDNYSFGNELVSVTDVEGDNVLLGEDGTVYFIDPIIRFKKPLREILAALGGAEQKAPTIGEQIQAAEAEVNTNPTEAQKEAGNYKKGHVQIGTFNVTIEQPKGSVRSGVDADGKKWETEMQNTYGYIRGTEGVDGDHIDVFLSDDIDGWDGHKVFVVDQRNADGSFDEHKVMLGFNDINDAEAAYMSNYEEGWQGLGAITGVSIEEFEKWIASSHRKTKAFAEYKSVKTAEGQSASAERRNLADFKEGDVVRDYYDKKLYRIKKHSKNGVSTIAMLDEEGNEVGTTQMNAHNNSRYSLAEAPVKAETTSTDAPYSIAPAQYTTKRGKVLDMHIVKFTGELTKEQQRAAKELAKADKGWYDREQGGFMMRSEESAKQLADTILGNEEAVSDAQPVSLADTRKVIEPKAVNVESLIGELNKKGEAKLSDHVEQPANPSGNRLVTDERYAELRERMRKKLGGQMNIGIDPEILAIGTEMAVYHLEKGARKFTEYARAMIADLGDAIRPYLKAFYNGARNLPEVESSEIAADMSSYDEVQTIDVANFDKPGIDALATAETVAREAEVEQEVEIAQERIKKTRSAKKETKKKSVTLQEQTGGLFDDLFTETNKADAEMHRKFAMTVKADMLAALDNDTKPYRSILDLRKRASELGMEVDNEGRTDILLQELVEDGLVRAAREVIERKGRNSRASYDLICKLYEMQPTIAARSSNRIKMQQYSTPLPMAWIANRFAMANKANGSVLEPTAGNGMLVFTVPVEQVHANELDETRLDNLREQGFAQVTQQDATEPFDGDVRYDVVIANPPFGKRDAVEYDGKMIPGLDPQITLNALSSMKDDGRAAIIIGGNMEYASNGAIKNMKPFFTYLYDHYNVKGVIDMGGGLYAKQGTTFPTRMILIDGRRSDEERAQTAVYPPVESKAIRKAETFDDLYEIINEVLNSNEKTNGTEILRSRQGQLASVNSETSRNTDGAGHRGQHRKNDDVGSRGNRTAENDTDRSEQVLPREHRTNNADGETRAETPRDNAGGSRSVSDTDIQRVGTERVSASGVGLTQTPTEHKKRTITDEKSAYRPHNSAFSLNSVAPAAMVEAMDKVLTQIEAQHGSIDEFIRTELGYDTVAEAHQALAAEQMDSVAMAIYQMKQGQALIIGDQTGVGKGRQMAALIRWAVKRGEKPVFITQKADLFSDIYRDLVDVGSGDLVPFIFNSDGAMVDSKGNTVHKPLSSAEMAKVFASGALPDEYDFAVLTYSQVNTGDAVSQQEMDEAAKKNGARTKKSKNVKNGKATPKATFLRAIAEDNYLFLDESHTAAGSSNTGAYLQSILRGAKAATFASATFAKRPDTMPLYAIRTAMSQAKVEPDKMISIIEKGGVTLQEIMSRELTNAGQMVRRERDMSDVVTDWKTITDPETVRRARENYDRTIAAFNAIIKFQEDYVKPMIEALDMELAVMAESQGVKRGTDKMGVENVPFASKTYNYTKQLMLALKVDAIADEVEAEINAGRHPVIALESTMESSIKDYAPGEIIDEPTFSASLLKGLDTVMQYTVKDEDGNERHERYSPKALGPAGEKAYYELQDFIRESTSDIFISPLDAIIERLNEKGYKVGELTGRNTYVERNADGRVVVKRRTDKDKKRMQREFNSGALDVLILNKSASTGISLHASEKFSDQRQRSMIIAQPLSDINDYMQMIGRIDRTGQVHRGYYINLGLPVPAENRFLMMLSTKLKSLNANTTTSQDSESNDVEAPDLLNKYGSQVVVEYLRDNVEIYERMGTPLKKGGLGGGRVQASELDDYKPQEDDARKITGYVALLTTKEQEEFYDDVVRRYNELIKYLNDTGSNDLKITVMPLRATTIEKRISSEGIDPNGNNPFARNSYVEKVEMDVLRKPMKADEIRKVIEQINRGLEPNAYLERVIDTVRKEDDARIAAEEERYEKSKAKAVEDIAKQTEKINGQKKRSDEEKRVAIENFIAETNEKVEAKHKDNIARLNYSSDQMMHRLRMFEVGKSYLVPDNLEAQIFDFATPAIFCGYKTKDSKITASTTLAVFATLDGRRRIEIKLSQIEALRSIDKMTNDNWDAARATTLDNWDSQIPSETRKNGYIMTGNILQAIADTQDQYGGYPGQLISYTDMDGNVHDGILMPDKWNATMLKTSGAPLSSRLQQIKEYQLVKSHDGKVEIMGSSWAKTFYLTVPKTKKDGAIYYENKTLLRAAGGNFYPYRGQLRADIPADRIDEVVKELTKLGVKVKEEHTDDTFQRKGDGAYTDDEVSFENDPISKVLGKPRFTRKQRREFAERERQRMVARVENLAKKLNLDNVEIITDASTLEGKKQRAKGFYTKSTGKITIVIPNHSSTFDVEQTLLHEAVAHYGLRQLFGEHFDTFLDNVFNNADEAIRQRIVALAAKNGWDFHKATEEYLAMLAENTEFENTNASWWRQIKDFFLNMLHKIGFEDFRGVTLTDNELRYILWRSYENLAEPGKYRSILGEAADVAKQYELGVGNYAVTNPNTPHAAESDDELYRDGTTLREEYDRKVRVPNKSGSVKWNENLPYRMKESYQDSMAALKTLQDLISEETGNQIQSHENAYMAENRMSSENKAQAEIYERDFYNPLRKAVQALIKAGSSYEDLKSYIIAKHGLERNEYMRTQAEQNGEDSDRDFAGLTALTGMDNVADAEAEAQRMVDEYEGDFSVLDLWEKINAATKETLRKSYDSGLMDKATYEKVRDMYEYYVPLRGWDCEVASNEYEYLTANRLMLSPALKVAKGRTSLADDPLATIGFMAESSIVQGNRNKMKQKFLNFILNNETDLVSVSEQWYVLDNATGDWEARNPIIPENATGDEVAAIVEQFEQEMEALGDKATKKRDGLKLSMNITKREGQEHVVRVKRNGKEYCLYINGSPRAAQAINGLTNPDVNDGSLYRAAKAVKHWMASMFTSKNPAFIATNLSRDVIWAGTAVAIKENAAYTARYTKNVSECLLKAQLPRLLVKFKNGTLDMNNELERYFDEFIRNGGETGFTQLNTVEDYKRNIKRFVKEAQGKGSITQKAWNGLWNSVEFLNRSAEDTTRFMVYMTSRQMGRDMARSIYDAKEITVNFNKKGSGGLGASVMNFSYIFFNATIQSLANFGKLMAKHPAKTTIALTLFSSAGFLVPMLNLAIQAMLGGDDDDENSYWDLPEWVRRNNIVLYVPWSENGYITIPLPHEMRPFYGMGEIAYSCLMNKEDVENGLMKATAGFSALLPIDLTGNGGNVAVNLTPTIGQPFAQIVANTDYFGKPIYKKHEWNERYPEWTKAYKGTAPWLVDGTRWLNEITGGDNVKSGGFDLNPALIEHLFESYLGGVGKTINKSQKTLEMLWNEDLREWRNVPVISSFYQTAEERTAGSQINREYFNAVDEMKDTQHLFSGYKREIRMGNIEYAEKVNELINSEVFKRYALVKGYDKAIKKASDALKVIEDPTKREDVETMIMNLKVEMLEKLEDLEERK